MHDAVKGIVNFIDGGQLGITKTNKNDVPIGHWPLLGMVAWSGFWASITPYLVSYTDDGVPNPILYGYPVRAFYAWILTNIVIFAFSFTGLNLLHTKPNRARYCHQISCLFLFLSIALLSGFPSQFATRTLSGLLNATTDAGRKPVLF